MKFKKLSLKKGQKQEIIRRSGLSHQRVHTLMSGKDVNPNIQTVQKLVSAINEVLLEEPKITKPEKINFYFED